MLKRSYLTGDKGTTEDQPCNFDLVKVKLCITVSLND